MFPRRSNSLLAPLLVLAAAAAAEDRARLLVLTDISSLTAGVREPDDGQSLIRLLLFSNEIEIEGLVATSNMRHGAVTRPELIREAIEAYAKVQPNLLLHDRRYPAAAALLAVVKEGQGTAGRTGEGFDTEGSDWIIRRALVKDRRPLWVAIWGGSTDLAQALWRLRASHGAEGRAAIGRLRVHSIYDQDETGPRIREDFPELFHVLRHHAIRGMYRYGETPLVDSDWVETHVRNGHGALGALYPNYDGGDIWVRQLGRVRGVKEGDTPSYLNLIANGLDALDGWGGRVEEAGPLRYVDAAGETPWEQVYRWRGAYQAEFQARLDWCVRSFREANHAPRVRVKERGTALDASGSVDPDGNRLSYEWRIGSTVRSGPRVSAGAGETVELTVRDDGNPPLTRYWRRR